MGVSRSAYYAWLRRLERPDPDQDRLQLVQEAYESSQRTYGYRRIQLWIQRQYGLSINHKAVLRLMRKLHIQSIARRRNPYRQMQKQYGARSSCANLLGQNFKAHQPNEKWGNDITYVRTQQGFVYLAVVKDFFDGSIVGFALAAQPSIRLVLRALRAAVARDPAVQGVILHSDQGSQYQSAAYQTLLAQYGIIPSMSRRGNCYDNAPTENFFSQLKEEWLRHRQLQDFQEALGSVQAYIHFYNYERIQLKTKLTPMEFRRQFV